MIANHERRKTCCINNKLYFITTIMTCAYLYCNYCHNNHHILPLYIYIFSKVVNKKWMEIICFIVYKLSSHMSWKSQMHFDLTNVTTTGSTVFFIFAICNYISILISILNWDSKYGIDYNIRCCSISIQKICIIPNFKTLVFCLITFQSIEVA